MSDPGHALDVVLAALASRDTAALAGARYTENGVELPLGEGLWATADRIGPYCHAFADPAAGQAAAFATVTEGETHSIMALRIALAGGAVREIEAIVARPPLFGTGGFGDGAAQLDGSGPAEAWFAEIPADERLSRDALRGIADAYFAGLERNDGRGDYPFADHCIRIENGFRIERGLLTRIEALMTEVPYGLRPGW